MRLVMAAQPTSIARNGRLGPVAANFRSIKSRSGASTVVAKAPLSRSPTMSMWRVSGSGMSLPTNPASSQGVRAPWSEIGSRRGWPKHRDRKKPHEALLMWFDTRRPGSRLARYMFASVSGSQFRPPTRTPNFLSRSHEPVTVNQNSSRG